MVLRAGEQGAQPQGGGDGADADVRGHEQCAVPAAEGDAGEHQAGCARCGLEGGEDAERRADHARRSQPRRQRSEDRGVHRLADGEDSEHPDEHCGLGVEGDGWGCGHTGPGWVGGRVAASVVKTLMGPGGAGFSEVTPAWWCHDRGPWAGRRIPLRNPVGVSNCGGQTRRSPCPAPRQSECSGQVPTVNAYVAPILMRCGGSVGRCRGRSRGCGGWCRGASFSTSRGVWAPGRATFPSLGGPPAYTRGAFSLLFPA